MNEQQKLIKRMAYIILKAIALYKFSFSNEYYDIFGIIPSDNYFDTHTLPIKERMK